VIPGVLIVVTVLCLYVVGDGVRDAFDPQSVKKK
jgi:peptide/nickel transport system permease protein